MSLTNFIAFTTPITAAWLNEVDTAVQTTLPLKANAANAALTGTSTIAKAIIGDAGTEGSGINISGITYESTCKVSDIDGTNYAQTILHRHSTTLEPLILGARSNSNTTSHADVTAGQGLFSVFAAGWAGSNYKLFGQESFKVGTGTISNTSAPGKWSLSVTPNGAVLPVETHYVDSDGLLHGNVAPATTGTMAPQFQQFTASSGSSNVGFIQSGTGAVTRTLQSKGRDFVSLFDFGAVGDGVTDDTAAIQAAIDAHDYVYIPEKSTFLFSKLTINRGNITLFGGGQSSVLKSIAAVNVAITVASAANVEVTRFRDFRLQGNATNIGGIALGTATFYTAYTELDNVRVDGFTNATNGYGLIINSAQELHLHNTRLQSNYFNLYRPNVVGYMTSTLITGGSSYYGLATNIGIYINGPFSELNISEDVVIEGNVNEGILVSGYSGHVSLNGCYFEGNATNGTGAVSISGGSGAYGQAKLTMKGVNFHANANVAKPQLYTNYVIGSEVSNCDGIFSSGGIVTTANSNVHFSNNKSPDSANPFVLYKALLGNISASDYDAADLHFNYGRRITFPVTATYSTDKNTIDDAKRNTFTPTANVVTFAQATGSYTKIWDLVVMHFAVQWPVTADAAQAKITNCPVNGSFGGLSIRYTDSGLIITGTVDSSGVLAFFNNSAAVITNANLSGKWIQGCVTYQEYNHP